MANERLTEARLAEARVRMVYDALMRELVGEIYTLRLERDRAVGALKWIDANYMILPIVLRHCNGHFLPSVAIDAAMNAKDLTGEYMRTKAKAATGVQEEK
jgi:hypothetical protein